MKPRVKICGVRSLDGARAIRDAAADFAGLNFVATSRRRVDPEAAHALIRALGPVSPVGVFADDPPDTVERIANALGLAIVQLHGSEPPDWCRALSTRFSVIKAMTVDERFTPEQLAAYAPHVTWFLLDGARPGSGTPFEWSRIERIASERPFFLAGGLTPANVSEAISRVRPFGVDTASGVEVDGAQHADRIRAFVRGARGE